MKPATSRRSFLITLGGAAAISALGPRVAAAADEQFPSEIATLYRKSVVIDTQCTSAAAVAKTQPGR